MSEAYYEDNQPHASMFDNLADQVRGPLRTKAGALALAADKTVTAYEKAKTAAMPALTHVRQRKVPYGLLALGIGIGVGLLLHKPSRRAAGSVARKAWSGSVDGFGRQLGKELRGLVRQ